MLNSLRMILLSELILYQNQSMNSWMNEDLMCLPRQYINKLRRDTTREKERPIVLLRETLR